MVPGTKNSRVAPAPSIFTPAAIAVASTVMPVRSIPISEPRVIVSAVSPLKTAGSKVTRFGLGVDPPAASASRNDPGPESAAVVTTKLFATDGLVP